MLTTQKRADEQPVWGGCEMDILPAERDHRGHAPWGGWVQVSLRPSPLS